ncbi:MAG: GNAT family N-acetyltransferase [Chloroflexi bacterium]|nr:GNAT family N-acetyltransferase [Chloroflexota bacterium]
MPELGLTFRQATSDDSDVLADLVIGTAEQEMTRVALALFGLDSLTRARALFRLTWRAAENWRTSTIAELDGEPVGMLQSGSSAMKVTPSLIVAALKALGPLGVARVVRGMRLQSKVSPRKPAGVFVISELHVSPAARGGGIGSALLGVAERRAREQSRSQMALVTLTTNPAIRLYERNGYRIAATATNRTYERLTGVSGRVLMLKDLAPTVQAP